MISESALAKLRELIGLYPDAQSVLPAEDLNTGNARDTGQLIL